MNAPTDLAALGVQRTPTANGVAYAFNDSPLGIWRYPVAILFNLLGSIPGLVVGFNVPVRIPPADWGDALFLAVVVVVFVIGLITTARTYAAVLGALTITAEPRRLVATRRYLAFSTRKTAKLTNPTTLYVGPEEHETAFRPLVDFFGYLRASAKSDHHLAWGYPAATFEAVAHDIAAALPDLDIRVRRNTEPEHQSLNPDRLEDFTLPPDSLIDLDITPDAVTVHCPPRGLLRGSQGLFAFSVLWNGFMAVFTTLMFLGGGPTGFGLLGIGAFLLLFWGVGIGMVVAGVHLGLGQTTLAVAENTLAVIARSPIRRRAQAFALADLRAIAVGPSGTEINDEPVNCLVLTPARGKPVKLLTALDDEELRVVAAVLRQATHLPASPDLNAGPPADNA
ncbi:MAG: hypothetical protein AAF078_14220 [Planctomycetota bacterium]